jgi:hypothetical protein
MSSNSARSTEVEGRFAVLFTTAIRALQPLLREGIMKPLVTTAVLGLLPVPPLPDTYDRERKRRRDDAPKLINGPDAARASRLVTDRMATPDELARLRDELDDLNVG